MVFKLKTRLYFKNIPLITSILIMIAFEGNVARKYNIIDDNNVEKRDYRPSKWLANSAMDVWYGNKSMVDIISRELSDLMNRIVEKRVRRFSVSNVTGNPFIPKNVDVPELERIQIKDFEEKLNSFFNSSILRWKENNRTSYNNNEKKK